MVNLHTAIREVLSDVGNGDDRLDQGEILQAAAEFWNYSPEGEESNPFRPYAESEGALVTALEDALGEQDSLNATALISSVFHGDNRLENEPDTGVEDGGSEQTESTAEKTPEEVDETGTPKTRAEFQQWVDSIITADDGPLLDLQTAQSILGRFSNNMSEEQRAEVLARVFNITSIGSPDVQSLVNVNDLKATLVNYLFEREQANNLQGSGLDDGTQTALVNGQLEIEPEELTTDSIPEVSTQVEESEPATEPSAETSTEEDEPTLAGSINIDIIRRIEADVHRSVNQIGGDAGSQSDGMLSKDELNGFVMRLKLDTDFLGGDFERDHLQAYLSTAADNIGTNGRLDLNQVLRLLRNYNPNQEDPTSDGLSSVLSTDDAPEAVPVEEDATEATPDETVTGDTPASQHPYAGRTGTSNDGQSFTVLPNGDIVMEVNGQEEVIPADSPLAESLYSNITTEDGNARVVPDDEGTVIAMLDDPSAHNLTAGESRRLFASYVLNGTGGAIDGPESLNTPLSSLFQGKDNGNPEFERLNSLIYVFSGISLDQLMGDYPDAPLNSLTLGSVINALDGNNDGIFTRRPAGRDNAFDPTTSENNERGRIIDLFNG